MTLAEDRRSKEARGRQDVRASYKDDPCTWALEPADLLHEGRLDLIDTINLADQIGALAHRMADELRSDLARVPRHSLKRDHQPERRSRSWAMGIGEHRRRVERHLARGPGLWSILADVTDEAFADGRDRALQDTDLPAALLPVARPYTWNDIMSRPIEWPEDS